MSEQQQSIEVTEKPRKHPRKRMPRRKGAATKAEHAIVEQMLKQQATEVTPGQERALAQVMQRSVATTKKMIQTAREKFADRAELYVDIHYDAAKGALDAEDYETAGALSQWAMKEISMEGTRIIDRANEAVQVPRVMVGIQLGGLSPDKRPGMVTVATDAEIIEHP